jgi:cytochrome c oxidase cbb3-type subunit 3
MWWLIWWAAKPRSGEAATGDVTGHTWDDDLQEFNNPMPRWWLWLFYGTIVFTGIYLLLYPGLGAFKGVLGWSEVGQYEREMDRAEDNYGPVFAAYAKKDIVELAKDPEGLEVGQRLYATYCATCHGSDARGARGFPNLADSDWQWGGEPDNIKTTILQGRQGVMPALGPALGEGGLDNVVNYVMSLSGKEADAAKAAEGKTLFEAQCVACHGADGKGNPMLGAPNLTDDVWLYGGSPKTIAKTIMEGRQGVMPAHGDFLGEDKVHVLSGYIYSLSQE